MQKIKRLIYSLISRPLPNHHEIENQISSQLLKFSQMPLSEIFQALDTDEKGLDDKKAKERLKKYQLNEIAHEKPPSWYFLLFKNFTNPFIALILALGIISFFLKEYDAVYIITFMVLISVFMRFLQEYRSSLAAEKLQALVSTKATVLRREGEDSKPLETDIKYLVPGDILHLSAGDMIPADVRLIKAKGLYVSQSTLSGESLPVEKEESFISKEKNASPLEMPNLCLMGTNVLNGTAQAVVLTTGNHTLLGSMAKTIVGSRPLTSFDLGINQVSWLLIKFIFIMIPVVLFINGFTKGNWFEAFLFALSVGVGLTPEMLPMIVTVNLAKGAVKMSEKKVIVKRLNAIQNFGAMDILCTDKTGTLTQDCIILEKYLDASGNDSEEVLLYGYLNSFHQTGLKNLLDVAVLNHREIEKRLQDQPYHKVDEIPFDFSRRRMSVVVEKTPGQHLLICKGSVEEILSVCSQVNSNGSVGPLQAEMKAKLDAIRNDLNEDGMRVLAVAYKEISQPGNKEYQIQDEQELIFFGFLAFLDPPKLSTIQALANLNAYSVQIKILTGDNEQITKKICKWVNLDIEGVLIGSQIDHLSDEELKPLLLKTTIFAKLAPLQKSRIISLLRSHGHTVGYLGDGINDAPALREADIGISVDTAVDIAKESADIIMLEKSLLFLGEGVLEGRRTFGNIIKYIKMALSSNFGNVFSIIGASILFPFLPLLPVQLLLQNLLYDMSQVSIPFDHVDREFLLKPRKWDPRGIAKFMIFIGPISSLFDYATFGVLWFIFAANIPEKQSLFQSGWFIEGLLSQTLIVHMIRTQQIPFFQSIASLPLLATTGLVMTAGILIPYSFIGASIGLTPLPGNYFYWLTAIILSYCVLTQFIKMWFIKKYHYWL